MNPCVVFMLCTLSLALAAESQNSATVYVAKTSVSEYTTGPLLFERETVSKVECAALCMSTCNCTSMTATYLHPTSTFACRGYADPTATAPTNATAAANTNAILASDTVVWVTQTVWLEEGCSSHLDCGQPLAECVSGKCLCSPGYYYSLSQDSCVHTCSLKDLQTRTVAYPGWRMVGHNMRPCDSTMTLEDDCLQLCADTPEVRTCDFWYSPPSSSSCCLQAVTRLNIQDSKWVVDPFCTHFQKLCA